MVAVCFACVVWRKEGERLREEEEGCVGLALAG